MVPSWTEVPKISKLRASCRVDDPAAERSGSVLNVQAALEARRGVFACALFFLTLGLYSNSFHSNYFWGGGGLPVSCGNSQPGDGTGAPVATQTTVVTTPDP